MNKVGDRLFPDRTLPQAEQEAHDIIERAKRDNRPEATFLLLSGGNDSTVLLDAMREHADAIVHINTGIGIPDTTEFVRWLADRGWPPYVEMTPPVPYEELVLSLPVLDGMPGPGVHHIVYQRLKDRCIESLLRQHRSTKGERYLLLTGIRRGESRRRMGYSRPIQRRGGQVWVNPLLNWTNEEMRAYRTAEELPENDVAAHLHMSGECLCGAMADQGPEREERAAIRMFYPGFDARLSTLEEECRRAGKRYCEWGVKRPADERARLEEAGQTNFLPLCHGCRPAEAPTVDVPLEAAS